MHVNYDKPGLKCIIIHNRLPKLEINVEAMDVEEGCSVEEGHRHGSFSSKDLPITRVHYFTNRMMCS